MLNNTQFLEFMKSFTNPEFFTNSIKMPNMDLTAFNGTCQKLMNVATTTQQKVAENMQAIAKRNFETLQKNFEAFRNSMQDAMHPEGLTKMADCHQQCIKSASETAIENIKKTAEVAAEVSKQTFDALNENAKKADIKVKA